MTENKKEGYYGIVAENSELFRAVWESSNDGMRLTDETGRIVKVNRAYCEIVGKNETDLEGQFIGIVYADPQEDVILDKYRQNYSRKAERKYLEEKFQLWNGKEVWLSASISYINLPDNNSLVLSVFHDITSRKEKERQLKKNEKTLKEQNKRLEKLNKKLKDSNLHIKEINEELFVARKKAEESNRLKTDFLANMSHEIRTPMNGILGFTNLLKRTNREEKRDHYVRIIEQSGNRMLNIINNVIDVSKIEAGLMEVVIEKTNLNNLLGGLFEFFRPEAERSGLKLFLHTGLPDKESIFETDRHKLEQVLSNLIKNAIKFTESGQIDFGYRIIGSEIEFFVRDTGPGIDQADKKAIFIRFWRVKDTAKPGSDGTGLGLPIASSLVSLMGGNIRVDSEKDKGSEFIVTLPFSSLIKKKVNLKNI